MTVGQFIYVAGLVILVLVVVVGSLIFPMSVFTALLLIVFGFAEWFRKAITPKGEKPQSPLTILEENPVWQGVGVAYTLVIILVVCYHLAVERLSFFEKINLPIFLVLILGAAAGPIAIHIARTYRLLGGKDKDEA